jgi:hypothetical protein
LLKGDLGRAFRQSGLTGEMKLELYAAGKNALLMRIENIGDTFDSAGDVIYSTVNVNKIATDLFTIANDGADHKFTIEIEETSLTANQSYDAMRNGRLKWKTVNDIASCEPGPEDFTAMSFQQQRIRTFKVRYQVEQTFLN